MPNVKKTRGWGIKKNLKRVSRFALKAGADYAIARYSRGGIPQLVEDVNRIKSLINVEKKYIDTVNASIFRLGQIDGTTGSAHYINECTCNPALGTSVQARSGSSVKVTGSIFRFQFNGQSAQTRPIRGRIYILRNNGPATSLTSGVGESTVTPTLLSPNQWVLAQSSVNIYDYQSIRNIDYLKAWKLLRTREFRINSDSYSGQNTTTDVTIKMKYKNYHVRFQKDTSSLASGQMCFLIVFDNGNMSTTTVGTAAVQETAINTGAQCNFYYRHYYVDN